MMVCNQAQKNLNQDQQEAQVVLDSKSLELVEINVSLEQVANSLGAPNDESFLPDECWSLRRGRNPP
jgi:hypothetical protein